MAPHSRPRITTSVVFPCQDDPRHASASMQRSNSQSTSCTVDSSYTTSSYSSGYYTTDYSSTGAASIEDGAYYDTSPTSSFFYPPSSSEVVEDTDQLLAATGSQYQHSGQQLPQVLQLSSPLKLFDSRMGNIEGAAKQATEYASSLVAGPQPVGGYAMSVITCEAVEDALSRGWDGGEEPVRAAVQDVLYQQLHRQFNDVDQPYVEAGMILGEAAYQLQVRLRGPEVVDICYYAIVAVLAQLRADLQAEQYGANSEPQGGKQRYACTKPECGQKCFSRSADLDRHYNMVHVDDEAKKKFTCDYRKCPRHEKVFYRQDHFRDHLRDYHKEDLPRRGSNSGADGEWWGSRAPRAVLGGWWRCNRCLVVRVDQAACGFVCPGCGNPCEPERQKYRMAVLSAPAS